MSTPTILSYAAVNSGSNLTVPDNTTVIVGVFFSNPSATLATVSPSSSANYSTNISIKVWDGFTVGSGDKALAGGATGYFTCLGDADKTGLEIYAGYSAFGAINEPITTNATCLILGGTKGTVGPTYLRENATSFNLRYNTATNKVGERTSGATMTVNFQDSGGGAVVYGCAVSIPFKASGGQFIAWSSE